MNEPKMTRSEFIAETVQLNPGIDVAFAGQMADAAERAGVTWKPEQVEPRVGERLTENTRLMNDLGAVTSNNTIWQYYEPERLWYGCKGVGPRDTSSSMIRHGGRIVFVPGSSPAEPESKPKTCPSRKTWSDGVSHRCARAAGHDGFHRNHRYYGLATAHWHAVEGQS